MDSIEARLDRIEQKLDTLIAALAEDEDQEGPTMDLEGNTLPAAREDGQEL